MGVRRSFMNGVRNVERRFLRKLRRKDSYKKIKGWVLLPVMVVVTILEQLERIRLPKIDKHKKKKVKANPEYRIKIANIVDGFAGLAFPNKDTEIMANNRAQICAACPHAKAFGAYSVIVDNKTKSIQGMKCDLCGCSLSAKVRSKNDSCPDGKW
jgi:hypothetical protein